jgi:hypothetical protein
VAWCLVLSLAGYLWARRLYERVPARAATCPRALDLDLVTWRHTRSGSSRLLFPRAQRPPGAPGRRPIERRMAAGGGADRHGAALQVLHQLLHAACRTCLVRGNHSTRRHGCGFRDADEGSAATPEGHSSASPPAATDAAGSLGHLATTVTTGFRR